MKNTLENFKSSARELKSVQVLALCGILLALRVVLGFLEINIENIYRISFASLPVSLGAMLFGPIIGGILGVMGDLITLIIHPIGFPNIGIILSKTLAGVIFGLFLYKKPISLIRTSVAYATVTVLCDLIITTVSLHMVYQTPYEILIPGRLINYLTLLPVNILLLYGAQVLMTKIKIPVLQNRGLCLAARKK
ncbi:MAG: folate family ECF transporter S component [Acutalibacteraceae bacterium]